MSFILQLIWNFWNLFSVILSSENTCNISAHNPEFINEMTDKLDFPSSLNRGWTEVFNPPLQNIKVEGLE